MCPEPAFFMTGHWNAFLNIGVDKQIYFKSTSNTHTPCLVFGPNFHWSGSYSMPFHCRIHLGKSLGFGWRRRWFEAQQFGSLDFRRMVVVAGSRNWGDLKIIADTEILEVENVERKKSDFMASLSFSRATSRLSNH